MGEEEIVEREIKEGREMCPSSQSKEVNETSCVCRQALHGPCSSRVPLWVSKERKTLKTETKGGEKKGKESQGVKGEKANLQHMFLLKGTQTEPVCGTGEGKGAMVDRVCKLC